MKKRFFSSLIVVTIAVISVGCGFLYNSLAHAADLARHPRIYAETVEECSRLYRVDDSVAYGVMKVLSDLDPSLENDGKTGLFQLTDEEYFALAGDDARDADLLFAPRTNVELGMAKLSRLYDKYKKWDNVFAALFLGEDAADVWFADVSHVSDDKISVFPSDECEDFVKNIKKQVAIYEELYS